MAFDFDTPIDRQNTLCEKWDLRPAKFGRADVLPLWVADMDFAAPPCVEKALKKRLEHPIFGYSYPPQSLYDSLINWFKFRYGWSFLTQQIILTQGVMPAIHAALQALTRPGDGVIVPTPVYSPFFSAISQAQCSLLTVNMLKTASGFRFNFEKIQSHAKAGAKVLLLCNPHNPVGRAWQPDELAELANIAKRYELMIISDDIHCDLTYPGERYTPMATIADASLRVITALSPGKTFNLSSLGLSAVVCRQPQDKKRIEQKLAQLPVNPANPLSMAAFEAAYTSGHAWLAELQQYLAHNRERVLDFISQQPRLNCYPPEATYLLWLDCSQLNLSPKQLDTFFVHRAGLGLNNGLDYGLAGAGFMRMNIATPKCHVEQALVQLDHALKTH